MLIFWAIDIAFLFIFSIEILKKLKNNIIFASL